MFNIKTLSKICNLPISSFDRFGKRENTPDGDFFFKDNNANILGVAHLDSVCQPNKLIHEDNFVYHPCLDDRLGAYLLLEVLSKYAKFDILLTEGEEIGCSTAAYFNPKKEYNWIFSFDRKGTDVVLYQYHDLPTQTLLESFGFQVSQGIFSDIAFMDHLGCKGINFGVGYHDYHSENAYADLNETRENCLKFIEFYKANKEVHLINRI